MRTATITAAIIATTLSATAEAQVDLAKSYDDDAVAWFSAVTAFNMGVNVIACAATAAAEGRDVLKDAAQCVGGSSLQSAAALLASTGVPFAGQFVSMTMDQVGTSIIDNTVAGKEPLSSFYYDVGPFVLEVSEDGVVPSWRLFSVAGIIAAVAQGGELDAAATLTWQTFVFKREMEGYRGYAMANVVSYDPSKMSDDHPLEGTIIHEMIHVQQYRRLQPLEHLMPFAELRSKIGLRVGEDVGKILLSGPESLCHTFMDDAAKCTRNLAGFPAEPESYAVQNMYK